MKETKIIKQRKVNKKSKNSSKKNKNESFVQRIKPNKVTNIHIFCQIIRQRNKIETKKEMKQRKKHESMLQKILIRNRCLKNQTLE